MNDLNNGVITSDDVRKRLAPDFDGTFSSLLSVMTAQETKQFAKLAKQDGQVSQQSTSDSTVTERKRPPQSPVFAAPVKRARPTTESQSLPPEPKTPDQPTHPTDPNFTGTSVESQDEENTKMLLKQFLLNTLSVLEAEFRNIAWQQSGCIVELNQTFLSRDTSANE